MTQIDQFEVIASEPVGEYLVVARQDNFDIYTEPGRKADRQLVAQVPFNFIGSDRDRELAMKREMAKVMADVRDGKFDKAKPARTTSSLRDELASKSEPGDAV